MLLMNEAFESEYRSGEHDIVQHFYHRALQHSKQYDRAVGFFSSSAFEAIGAPLGEFISRGGSMRLVTSVRLSPEDIQAIETGIDRVKVCHDRLLEEISSGFQAPLGKGTFLLASLLAVGRLDIRIAIPRNGAGIYHEKIGIFCDADGKYIVFTGSSNESRSALEANYECIDVFTSWHDVERAKTKKRHFERLWEGLAPGAETLQFPEAAKRALLAQYSESSILQVSSQTSTPDIDHLWRHQKQAVEAFLQARRGILEMATGTGKTRTALHICHYLLTQNLIDTILIAAHGTDLMDQWYGDLLGLARASSRRLAILRHYDQHHQRDQFELRSGATVLLASRSSLTPALRSLSISEAKRTLLIHDEVHGLGSEGNRTALRGLSRNIEFRLGLSATPERDYDDAGNAFVSEHVGPVLFEYHLEDAIREKILAPFNYFPLNYTLDESDHQRRQSVYKKAAARRHMGNPMSNEEIWIEIAKVYKISRAKLPPFEAFLGEHSELLRRCIIFVETREYGDEVISRIHRYRHDFHPYYAEEHKETLRRFSSNELECLITCHRLSEGIDIRSIETVMLFSSSKGHLETIQRIGRCLRVDPKNPQKRANVVDFIRASDTNEEEGSDNPNPDLVRRSWLEKLSTIVPERVTYGA